MPWIPGRARDVGLAGMTARNMQPYEAWDRPADAAAGRGLEGGADDDDRLRIKCLAPHVLLQRARLRDQPAVRVRPFLTGDF